MSEEDEARKLTRWLGIAFDALQDAQRRLEDATEFNGWLVHKNNELTIENNKLRRVLKFYSMDIDEDFGIDEEGEGNERAE